MAIYEFICKGCKVIWEREASMKKAPSRSRCPECKKLSERYWGNIPVIFNGSDYHTVKRNQHNLVYKDKAKAKEVHEGLVDIAKKQAEEQTSPYKKVVLKDGVMDTLHKEGKVTRKTDTQLKDSQKTTEKIKASVYNNHSGYRNLGNR